MAQAPSDRHAVKIAVICALPLEAGMVESVFDKFWNDTGRSYGKAHGDQNSHTVGLIGKHNVVLAHMPSMGSNNAATVAAGLRSSFRGIEIAFVVGICGVMPTNKQTKQDIFLGDCIISTAMVQYDFGRQYPHGFVKKHSVQDSLGRANLEIRSLTSMLTTPRNQEQLTQRLAYHLDILQEKRLDVRHPGRQRDRLFEPSYIHQHHQNESVCDMCLVDTQICLRDCVSIRCEDDKLIKRERSHTLQEPLPKTNYSLPNIHFGRFGSANTVMKSGLDRDRIAEKDELIAFEMEGSGVWDVFPTIIIKSACDYADSHKSKEWQPYAAGTAAAGLKAFLERYEVTDEPPEKDKYRVPFSIRGLPVTKKFIARPAEMQNLEEVLLPQSNARRKTFVLRGLGGIGKTQLAIEFMRTHHSSFSAVFWLDGSSEDSLKRALAQFAGKISPEQMSEHSKTFVRTGQGDINDVVQEVLGWLDITENTNWLLVFDNVDRDFKSVEPDPFAYDIEQYLPGADHGSVLITTRLAQMEQLGDSQEVKKVNSDAAHALLDSWYKKPYDEDDAKQLLGHLDGLPLAIAQAGAYLQESGMNIKTYLRFYEDMQKDVDELLHSPHVDLRDYPNRSIWTTWNISYSSILAEDEYVAHLLVLWAFIDRNDFWYGIFEQALARAGDSLVGPFSEWLGDIATQESSFIRAMHLLRRYSLVESSMETDGYSMHTVVHRWAYSYRGLKHQKDLGILALILVGFAVPKKDEYEDASLLRRLLPHAQNCTNRALDLQAVIVDQGIVFRAIYDLGILYDHQIKYEEAEKMFTLSLQGFEALGHKEPIFNAVNNLSVIYMRQGKLNKAEKMCTRALQGKEEAFGAKHTSTLDTVSNLALVYSNQGKHEEAEKMCTRALQGYEEVFGAKHKSTLGAIHNLGQLYAEQGKLEEAEKAFIRALQGKEEVLGNKHPSTLHTINNLGVVYKNRGRFSEAGKIYLRALQGQEEVLGNKHPSTLDTVHNLGTLFMLQSKLDAAERMLIRALQGYEEVLGNKHLSTLDIVNNLGILCEQQGKLDEAEMMYIRALQGYEETFGVEGLHAYIPALRAASNLGDLYSKTRPDESRAMYTKALSGFTIVVGASSNECLHLQRRLDALDPLPRNGAIDLE